MPRNNGLRLTLSCGLHFPSSWPRVAVPDLEAYVHCMRRRLCLWLMAYASAQRTAIPSKGSLRGALLCERWLHTSSGCQAGLQDLHAARSGQSTFRKLRNWRLHSWPQLPAVAFRRSHSMHRSLHRMQCDQDHHEESFLRLRSAQLLQPASHLPVVLPSRPHGSMPL